MPNRLTLFTHGFMRLIVVAIHPRINILRTRSALVKEKFCKLEILFLTRMLIQPHKRELNLRMPTRRESRIPLDVKTVVDIISIFAHRREKFMIDITHIKSNGRFNQMPRTVKFVLRSLHENAIELIYLIIAVEISAGKLIFDDLANGIIDNRTHFGIGIIFLEIRCRLQPLGDIGIKENVRRIFLLYAANCFKTSRLCKTSIHILQRYKRVFSDYFFPEAILKRNTRIRNRGHSSSIETHCLKHCLITIIEKTGGNVNPRP